jgi:hypothetical protein
MWIGAASAPSAPFSVTKNGVVYARAINVSTAIVKRSSAQSIPTNTNQTVYYNSQVYVIPSSMHSISTNSERLIAPIKGIYKIEATGVFEIKTTGGTYRQLAIYDQDGTVLDADYREATVDASVYVKVMATIPMDMNDYVYSKVFHWYGSNLNYTPYYFSLTLSKILD